MYAALVDGGRPIRLAEPGSYLDYCVRERASLSALTLESPEIRQWIEFAEHNGGTLPGFPLPLGDESVPADTVITQLMNERQTAGFESACVAAGARFSGGVFACAALAQYELTGAEIYSGITSVDNPPHPGRLHDGRLVRRLRSGRRPDHRIVFQCHRKCRAGIL